MAPNCTRRFSHFQLVALLAEERGAGNNKLCTRIRCCQPLRGLYENVLPLDWGEPRHHSDYCMAIRFYPVSQIAAAFNTDGDDTHSSGYRVEICRCGSGVADDVGRNPAGQP